MTCLLPKPVSVTAFTWMPAERMFVAEMSEIRGFGRVYDDACDEGLDAAEPRPRPRSPGLCGQPRRARRRQRRSLLGPHSRHPRRPPRRQLHRSRLQRLKAPRADGPRRPPD